MWTAAEGDGQAEDDDRSLAVAAVVATAAEQRNHHVNCTTVSLCGRVPPLHDLRTSHLVPCPGPENHGGSRRIVRFLRYGFAGVVSLSRCSLIRYQECGRHRSCGHRCRLPCHEGKQCPPCPEPCTLSCEHSSCAQACIGESCLACHRQTRHQLKPRSCPCHASNT